MSDDRTKAAVAALGSALTVSTAVQAPALIPALTLGVGVWMAACAFLRL